MNEKYTAALVKYSLWLNIVFFSMAQEKWFRNNVIILQSMKILHGKVTNTEYCRSQPQNYWGIKRKFVSDRKLKENRVCKYQLSLRKTPRHKVSPRHKVRTWVKLDQMHRKMNAKQPNKLCDTCQVDIRW